MADQTHARSSLLHKYALLVAALVSAAVLVSGLSSAWFAYRDSEVTLEHAQSVTAAAAVSRIEQFVDECERALRSTIILAQLDPAEELVQRHEDLRRLLRQTPALSEVAYLDGTGHERIRVSRVSVDHLGSNADRSTDPAYVAARAGQAYFGPVYFREESEPYLTVAVPDETPAAGVTVAEVNLRLIWDVISQIRVEDNGDAYIVSADRHIIAHRDLALVLGRTDVPDIASLGGTTIATDPLGRRVLSTSAAIPRLGWTVFVEQPLGDVFAPLYASVVRTALRLIAGLALSVAAGVLLVRHMLEPIKALGLGAARLGAGALDQPILVQTGDELEALAHQFNLMAVRHRESHTTLEEKVEKRTKDLAIAVTEIERQRGELADWAHTLEERVEHQVGELERFGRLRRFLSDQVADLIMTSGEQNLLESHRREIAVVACGLRGFAGFADSGEPEEVMAVVGEFHAAMGEVVNQFGGTLERFAGEGFVVLFNDPVPCPNPAERAIRMVVTMRDRGKRLSSEWRQRGHELRLAAGVAIGYATLGTITFAGRQDYVAVGGVSHQATDLYASAGPGQIILSQRVYAAVRELVRVNATGRGIGTVNAYELVALKIADLTHPPQGTTLTAREREVAALIARGLTNRQISELLVITERTVATHIEHIVEKLDFATRTQIGVWASENGLLSSVPA